MSCRMDNTTPGRRAQKIWCWKARTLDETRLDAGVKYKVKIWIINRRVRRTLTCQAGMSHLVFGAEYKRVQQTELLPVLKPLSLLAFEPSRLLAFRQTTHRLYSLSHRVNHTHSTALIMLTRSMRARAGPGPLAELHVLVSLLSTLSALFHSAQDSCKAFVGHHSSGRTCPNLEIWCLGRLWKTWHLSASFKMKHLLGSSVVVWGSVMGWVEFAATSLEIWCLGRLWKLWHLSASHKTKHLFRSFVVVWGSVMG